MWDRWLDEIKAEAARRQQKRAERFADNIGIDQVKNLVKINRRYWWMDDQVKIGLARDGFGADDPQTEAVARESARTKRDWLVQYMPQSVRNALNSTSSNMLIGDSPVTLRQTREESSAPSSLFRGRENPGQAHTQDALDATDAVGEELFGSTWKFRGRQNSRPGAVQNALSSAASTIKEAHAQHEASLDRNVRDPRAGLVGQMNSTDEMIAAAKEVRAGDLSEEEFAMRFSLPYSATAKGKSLIGAPVWAGDELTPRGDPSSKVGTESGTWTERAYVAEMWQSLSNQEQINAGGYSDAQLDEITSQLRREDPDMWDMTRASGETMRMGTEPLSMTERFVDSAKTTGRIFFIAAESGLQMVDSSIRETGAAVKERDITRLPGVSGYEAAYKTAQEAKETGDYSAIPSMFGMAAFGEQNWRQSDAGVTIDMMTGNWNYGVYDTQQREALKVLYPHEGENLGFDELWGDGWIPQGGAELLRYQRELDSPLVDGHVATVGRMIASGVAATTPVNPDDVWYNTISGSIDFAKAVYGPSEILLDEALMFAARAMRPGLRSLRTDSQIASWLSSEAYGRMSRNIAANPSPSEIWIKTGRNFEPEMAVRLADETNPDVVARIIGEEAGVSLRNQFQYLPHHTEELSRIQRVTGNVTAGSRMAGRRSRLLSYMPASTVSLTDGNDFVRQMERVLKNSHLSKSFRNSPYRAHLMQEGMDKAMRATSEVERFDTAIDILQNVVGATIRDQWMAPTMLNRVGLGTKLTQGSVDEFADKLTRAYASELRENQTFWVNELGENQNVWGFVEGGEAMAARAHLNSELANSVMPLPSARELKAATARPSMRTMGYKADRKALKAGAALDSIIEKRKSYIIADGLNDIWKGSALLRFAWPLRVIGEEQFRLAATGFDNLFTHPIHYVSGLMAYGGRGQARTTKMLELLDDKGARELVTSLKQSLAETHGGWRHRSGGRLKRNWNRVDRANLHTDQSIDEFIDNVADEIAIQADNPVSRFLVDNGIDKTKAWFWNGDGRTFRDEIVASKARDPEGARIQYADVDGDLATSRAASDAYVQSIFDRLNQQFQMNPDILDVVRKGRVSYNPGTGRPSRMVDFWDANSPGMTPEFKEGVRQMLKGDGHTLLPQYDEVLPQVNYGVRAETDYGKTGKVGEIYNRFMDWSFYWLMSAPTNQLSRSVAWRIQFLEDVERLAPFMSPAARTQVAGDLRRAAAGSTDVIDMTPAAVPKLSASEWERAAEKAGMSVEDLKAAADEAPEMLEQVSGLQAFLNNAGKRGMNFLDRRSGQQSLNNLADRIEAIDDPSKVRATARSEVPKPVDMNRPVGQADIDEAAEEAATLGYGEELAPGTTATTMDLSVDAEEAYMLAKGYALDETKKLLYDVANRSQFADTMHLVAPFGEAWGEMVKVWTDQFTARPNRLRRLQQGVEAGRSEGFNTWVDQVTGDEQPDAEDEFVDAMRMMAGGDMDAFDGMFSDEGTGSGVFHTNQWGEEVFTYPMPSWMASDYVLGMPITLEGRLAGLSLMTEVLPGFGPAVQYPYVAITNALGVGDDPALDWLDEILMPYGEVSLDPNDMWRELIPNWLDRGIKTLTNDPEYRTRLRNRAMDYLMTTGDYDLTHDDPSIVDKEWARLLDDANNRSFRLGLLMTAATFVSPSAPIPVWMVELENGRTVPAYSIAEQYYDLLDEYGYEIGKDKFHERYGDYLYGAAHPQTSTQHYGGSVTATGYKWIRDQSGDRRSDYDQILGLWAPGVGEDIDSQAYNSSYEYLYGGRLLTEHDKRADEINNAIGSYHFNQKRDAAKEAGVADTPEGRQWLREWEAYYAGAYPGFREVSGSRGQKDTEEMMEQMTRAWENEEFAGELDVWEPFNDYMTKRKQVADALDEAGLSTPEGGTGTVIRDGFTEGKTGRPLVEWLWDWGEEYASENEHFQYMWDRVLSHEIPTDLTSGSPPEE